MLLSALSAYAALLGPALFVGLLFWGTGWFLASSSNLRGSGFDDTPKAGAMRWIYVLLGGPLAALLMGGVVGLVSGEIAFDSTLLTIGLLIVAGIVAAVLSLGTLVASFAIGVVHGRRRDARQLARTNGGAR